MNGPFDFILTVLAVMVGMFGYGVVSQMLHDWLCPNCREGGDGHD